MVNSTLQIIQPTLRRSTWIGLSGCLLIFASIWLGADKEAGPRRLLIIGCSLCGLSLFNYLIWLFTEEAKECIWRKGGLFSVALTPATCRGMRIGSLGLIIMFFGMGLFWLEVRLGFFMSFLGWAVGGLGMINHWRWFWKRGSTNIDS